MPKMNSVRIENHFQDLTDPRRREVTYPLVSIVVIAVCAVICGADDFISIARFGDTKEIGLKSFWDLSTGIPLHEQVKAVFSVLNPVKCQECILS